MEGQSQKGDEGRFCFECENSPELAVLSGNPLKFFGNRSCPYCHRGWWAMHEKEVEKDWDYIHIDLGSEKPEWYKELNFLGTIPLVVDNGNRIYESLIIAEYFDDKYPERGAKLFPSAPEERALARLLLSRFGEKVPRHLYALQNATDLIQQEQLRQNLIDALVDFNREVLYFCNANKIHSEGPYYLGAFSIVDIGINTLIDRFSVTLKYYRDFDILTEIPSIEKVVSSFQACKSRPAFQDTSQNPEYYCWAVRGRAGARNCDLKQ